MEALVDVQQTLERQRDGLQARCDELDRLVESAGEERESRGRELRDCKTAIAAIRRLRGLPARAPRPAPPIAVVR